MGMTPKQRKAHRMAHLRAWRETKDLENYPEPLFPVTMDYYTKEIVRQTWMECLKLCREHPSWTAGMIAKEIKNRFGEE
jgi:hypothetical protein